MVGDVDDLRGEEPWVDGVADRADAGHREIDLEMTEAVPGERADAVARLDAEPLQGIGEAAGARMRAAQGRAVNRALHGARPDPGPPLVPVGAGAEPRVEQ